MCTINMKNWLLFIILKEFSIEKMQVLGISTMKYSKIDVLAKLIRKITLLKNVLFAQN